MITATASSNVFPSARTAEAADAADDCAESLLATAGYCDFEDYWRSPSEFVEPMNVRRNGWSAVSLLSVPDAQGRESRFYLKRQENQLRYSWRHPIGALTYQYEVEAFQKADCFKLPTAELITYGFRRNGATRRGIVVTREIALPALSDFQNVATDWPALLPALRNAGRELLRLHLCDWQHGALYPSHIFIDPSNGRIRLIDFERARRACACKAAEADLLQFLKRADWIPDVALAALLEAYRLRMPGLLHRLGERFPHRSLLLQEPSQIKKNSERENNE
ncbi:MAG: lipopolysaccharide kinase InaA family protein [Gammaproteobacteria bacterium]|nr:lipopolysaccharide kinase InaA family protein [Gammaproteobacteria bacterium]